MPCYLITSLWGLKYKDGEIWVVFNRFQRDMYSWLSYIELSQMIDVYVYLLFDFFK